MIEGIRRRLQNSIGNDPWDTEQLLSMETEGACEIPTDTAVILAATQAAPGYSPDDGSPVDYYRSIVRTALGNGGRYGGHQISVPWLRMILAGLEGRHVEPDTMWYAAEEDLPALTSAEIPSYEDLFPSERDSLPRTK